MRTTLIWPYASVAHSGSNSSHSAAATKPAATLHRPDSTIVIDSTSSTTVVTFSAAVAAGSVIQANGAKAIAASGGYVNGSGPLAVCVSNLTPP